jgi:sulfiredoxin
MQEVPLKVDEIYIPVARRKSFKAEKAEALAEDILENGQQRPIQVRQGKGRYVLIEGLHRLEAIKLLGEENILGYIVSARQF